MLHIDTPFSNRIRLVDLKDATILYTDAALKTSLGLRVKPYVDSGKKVASDTFHLLVSISHKMLIGLEESAPLQTISLSLQIATTTGQAREWAPCLLMTK